MVSHRQQMKLELTRSEARSALSHTAVERITPVAIGLAETGTDPVSDAVTSPE